MILLLHHLHVAIYKKKQSFANYVGQLSGHLNEMTQRNEREFVMWYN